MERYTSGIREIYEGRHPAGTKLKEVAKEAFQAGYKLVLFNGQVYHIIDHVARDTGLKLSDFEC